VITKAQAAALRRKIQAAADARSDREWSRGGDPADWDACDKEDERAKKDLERYINKITKNLP
jgi:hypothetical protein